MGFDIQEILLQVRADIRDADTGLSAVQRRLADLDKSRSTATVDVDDARATTAIDRVKARLDEIGRTRVTAKVDVDTAEATRKLSDLKLHGISAMQGIGAAAIAVGPQIVASLGRGIAGGGALGIALGGAATAFGVLGLAAKSQLTAAEKQQTKYEQAVIASQKKVVAAQAAVDQAYATGTAKQQASAQQRLALAQQQNDLAKAQASSQGDLARQVVTGADKIKAAFIQALGPGTRQLFAGILSLFDTLKGSLGGLTGPFTTLGRSIKDALSSPATQAGIRSLIDGFGKMVTAVAPLTGPILRSIISLGEVFLNIARAAMPELVREVTKLADWLGKVAASTSDQAHLKDVIHGLVAEFDRWIGFVVALIKALSPLFTGEALKGIQDVLNVIVLLVGAFAQLLVALGPIGRLFIVGLGLAFFAVRLKGLVILVGALKDGFIALKVAMLASAAAEGGLLAKVGAGLAAGKGSLLGRAAPAAAAGAAGAEGAAVAGGAALAPETLGLSLAIAATLAAAIHWRKQIKDVFSGAVKDLGGVLSSFGHVILPAIAGPLGIGLGAVIAWRHPIGNAAHAAGQAIVSGVKAGASGVASAVSFIANHAVAIVRGVIGAAGNAGAAVIHAVGSAISAGAGFVEHAVTSIAGRIGGWIKGAIGDIASVGRAIAQGLANGIASGASWVADAAKNLASGAVSTAKSILGISSPSKVMHAAGIFVAQGLANGIKAGAGLVGGAAGQLAASAVPDFSGVGAAVGRAGAAINATRTASHWTELINLTRAMLAELKGIHKDLGVSLGGSFSSSLTDSLSTSTLTKGTLGSFTRIPRTASPIAALGAAVGAAVGGAHPVATAGGLVGGQALVNIYQNNLHPADPQVNAGIAAGVSNAFRRNVLPVPVRIGKR